MRQPAPNIRIPLHSSTVGKTPPVLAYREIHIYSYALWAD